MAKKKILLKDGNGNILLPITQTDLVQHTYFTGSHDEIIDGKETFAYHNVLLSSYLESLHQQIIDTYSYIGGTYTLADVAYTLAYTAYGSSEDTMTYIRSMLSSSIITGNQTDGIRLIQSIYFNNDNKLQANLIDLNANIVEYTPPAAGTTTNASNVQEAVDALNAKIDTIETMDLYSGLDSGDGILVSKYTTEPGASISARVDNSSVTFDDSGRITVGNVHASYVYTVEQEYIPSQDAYVNVNKPIDETLNELRAALGIEAEQRISSDEELAERINSLVGMSYISSINVNNDAQNVYPDSTGTAYINIAIDKLKTTLPVIDEGTSYTIVDGDDGDDLATMIAKLQAQVFDNKNNIKTSYDTLFAYIEDSTLTFEMSEVKSQYDKNIIIF